MVGEQRGVARFPFVCALLVVVVVYFIQVGRVATCVGFVYLR